MTGLLNFISVCNVLVDPDAKLIVRGDPGYVDRPAYISVTFDPQIERNNLTVERSEDDKQRWARVNTRPAPPLLFRSEKAEKLTDIIVHPVFEDCALKLIIRKRELNLYSDANAIGRINTDRWMGEAYEVLLEILVVSIELPVWDDLAQSPYDNKGGRISLWLNRSFAEELASHSSFRFDPSTIGDILVAERQVRS